MKRQIKDMVKEYRNHGNVRYMIRLSKDQTTTGKPERIFSVNGAAFDSYTWAESVCLDLLMQIKAGNRVDPAFFIRGRKGKYLFADFVKTWLKDKESMRPATIKQYESTLRNSILPFWGGKDLRQISKHDAVLFRQQLTGAATSKNCAITTTNNIFRFANDLFGLHLEPIKRFKEVRKLKEPIDESLRRLILSRIKDEFKAMVYTWAYTGMRDCELRAIRKSMIQWEDKMIKIKQHYSAGVIVDGTKEGDEKEIRFDLLYDLEPLLREACSKVGDDDLVFPYTQRQFYYAVKQAMKGIVDIRPTVLGRSTTITQMVDEFGIRPTMKQVGHKKMQTTDRYDQATDLRTLKPNLRLMASNEVATGEKLEKKV